MSFLTRPQFDQACQAFIAKYSDPCPESLRMDGLKGWVWTEHSYLSGLGYMHRTVALYQHQEDAILSESAIDEEDEATSSLTPPQSLTCRQYVIYATSFQVPAFYFSIHDSNGSPLALKDLVRTCLFRHHAFTGVETSAFALGMPGSAFPLVSQGDHPTLGIPCWYFHPCETPKSVGDIMTEVEQPEWSEQERLVRWLEAWFMIVGTVVCFDK
ncbi:hypothetical protein HGRIS_009784 [Hohenbuehelia grisea]|uniref:Ubiquitin-like-conjugating enzyme ATG10 n=1 Tax=Hohenbuehelia grisea TaxID=104357 RepID=A0ABR3J285_9AGAR